MDIDYQGLVTQGLAKQISEKIRDAILEGRLQVHEQLPTEEALAARFDVSRPTVREALKRLAAQNLVRSRRGPRGGTFVNRPTQDEARLQVGNAAALLVSMGEFTLEQIAEARLQIELVCCRLAAERRTQADLDALAAEIRRQRDATLSDVEFCASDVRFHRSMIDAARNPVLGFAAAGVIESLQPAINLVVFRLRDRHQVAQQHERIRESLAARDPEVACGALTEYMNTLRGQYRKARTHRPAVAKQRSRRA